MRKPLSALLLVLCLLVPAACDNSEERAEKYYQSGLSYIAKGDVDRALVEFRNVFKLNGKHREARRLYASIERERGDAPAAFSQYLRLVEQYPDDEDALKALAEIAIERSEFDTGLRYATIARDLKPDNAEYQALVAAAEYGQATENNDVTKQLAAIDTVRKLRELFPKNLILHQVIIDDRIRAQDYPAALAELDLALQIAPQNRALYAHKLSILAAQGDDEGVETNLNEMIKRFPDAPEIADSLVRWYVSKKQIDKAEVFLRGRIEGGTEADIFNLVRFLSQQRGAEAVLAELDRAIASGQGTTALRSARAGFLFDTGQKDKAIADMKAILESSPSSEETRRTKVALARMLSMTGNPVGAQAYVDEVLAEDSGETEALKLKAAWLIEDDEVGDAIAVLRRALDNDPRDAQIMTLMAQGYDRDGNRDLTREMLSRAVEASGRAPAESLRYAQFLVSDGKLLPAEGILIDALRLSPGEPILLRALGELYLRLKDWPRATAVAQEMETSDNEELKRAAAGIRAAVLSGQKQTDDAVGYLQGLVDSGDNSIGTKIAILRTHIDNGQIDRALAYADNLMKEDAENPEIRFVDASVRVLAGQAGKAEETFRDLVKEDPSRLAVWLSLVSVVGSDEARRGETAQLIEKALAANPQSGELKWAKAGLLEATGDIDGAIAIYEDLYKENSGNPVVANNLASLLSNFRADKDSLDRAEIIARRLRGSGFAPYQDTYGWIAHLRGNNEDALAELEPAAAGLPKDPSVQYHLAEVYLALDRKSDALRQFELALDLVDAATGDEPKFAASMRENIRALSSEGVTIGN
ncbi:MAG: tetratricopeptide repeat protein [Rhodobacteraceae bacterium]|nr:tetratricopeptide repeat protein [Paracoccaceae bacterium]